MEKFLKPCDKECMRMAMLKHEETFKEQVCELHRLYRTQKIMMRNIESKEWISTRSQELWSSKNGLSFYQSNHARDMKLDLERPAELYGAESKADTGSELIDESEIQLTLGPSSYNRRKKRETPLTSDSGPSLSSTSTGSSHINRTSSLTNQKIKTRREELSGPELRLFQVPDIALGYQNGSKSSIGVEEHVRQERLKQPPWLCQVLRLNIT
ncbi:hypothetical protein SADUNF_Sadunf07G0049300 [Salix dunnii]|uniref:Uncharacterized protein n=1 Tax=Salix dunnii TaxID=1413687 RepID=A0A835JZE6_9ROSI|nr:hypothetical protein SADUNF_Sadunf07G0049300 [Salix dunnii]